MTDSDFTGTVCEVFVSASILAGSVNVLSHISSFPGIPPVVQGIPDTVAAFTPQPAITAIPAAMIAPHMAFLFPNLPLYVFFILILHATGHYVLYRSKCFYNRQFLFQIHVCFYACLTFCYYDKFISYSYYFFSCGKMQASYLHLFMRHPCHLLDIVL